MPPPESEQISHESQSLRRLARGLLYEPAHADDVVQEAWLASLRDVPPRGSLRGWLFGTVRRLSRQKNREEARRRRREGAAARREALPDTVDALARIETLRRVVDAVGCLDEPYRTTILLRYFAVWLRARSRSDRACRWIPCARAFSAP